jgi:hypothetical protein
MADINITCALGTIASEDTDVAIDAEETAPNSNKWVFDVEQDTSAVLSFSFSLIDTRTGKVKDAEVLSISLTPIDAPAAAAQLHAPVPFTPVIELAAIDMGVINYRVTVDAIHSMVR